MAARITHFLLLLCTILGCVQPAFLSSNSSRPKVLILGGGVSGIIAARTLHESGISDFRIIEARSELGGRMRSFTFGEEGRQLTLELGANWIQGTQEGNGPANPILTLAKKHGLNSTFNDLLGSVSTFDETGAVDYLDTLNDAVDALTSLTVKAGERVTAELVDASARTGYSLLDVKPKSPQEKASEYYQYDWEYAQTPEESSWIASSWNNNFTFDTDVGGFSEDNLLSTDQRGFKHLIVAEAEEFLQPGQVVFNATVASINHSEAGVQVILSNGTSLEADYVIATFSLGVLQNDDVSFKPALPEWKVEAVQSMAMAVYTKIFLQFPQKFWFDTQMALYADKVRGRYPVWQNLDAEGFFPGSGVIFVTVTGEWSKRVEVYDDARIQAEVLGVLGAMFPNVTIPEPTAFHFPRWFSDPLYRGTYSNWPTNFVTDHHTNLRANVGSRLWFSGEALSEKYYGFLHGAYFEGLASGQSVASCIKGNCTDRPHFEQVRNAKPYDL